MITAEENSYRIGCDGCLHRRIRGSSDGCDACGMMGIGQVRISSLCACRGVDVAGVVDRKAECAEALGKARVADCTGTHVDAAPVLADVHGQAMDANLRSRHVFLLCAPLSSHGFGGSPQLSVYT